MLLRIAGRVAAFGAVFVMIAGFPSPGRENDEPISCRNVTLADVGEGTMEASSAATAVMLKALGYRPAVKPLAVPATYAALKSGEADVFLGHAAPAMDAAFAPYRADGSIEDIGVNLRGTPKMHTVARKGFADECNNVGKLLKNQKFSTDLNAKVTQAVQSGSQSPEDAAAAWLAANPDVVKAWIKDVKTFDKKDSLRPVKAALGL